MLFYYLPLSPNYDYLKIKPIKSTLLPNYVLACISLKNRGPSPKPLPQLNRRRCMPNHTHRSLENIGSACTNTSSATRVFEKVMSISIFELENMKDQFSGDQLSRYLLVDSLPCTYTMKGLNLKIQDQKLE